MEESMEGTLKAIRRDTIVPQMLLMKDIIPLLPRVEEVPTGNFIPEAAARSAVPPADLAMEAFPAGFMVAEVEAAEAVVDTKPDGKEDHSILFFCALIVKKIFYF